MLVRVACLLAAVLLVAACSSQDEPPPRNPLASPTPAGTAAPTASPTAAPTAAPTLSPTASTAPPSTPAATASPEGATDEQQLELATGNAIEFMAEWLGTPATELEVDVAEAVVWPDACLGVVQPGVACATVLTPGFRIVLRDAFGGLHRVHASSDGVLRWAGEAVVIGKVVSVEGAAIVLGDVEGDHAIPGVDLVVGDPATVRDAPGSSYIAVAGPQDLAEGVSVAVALDPHPEGGSTPLIAWLAVLE